MILAHIRLKCPPSFLQCALARDPRPLNNEHPSPSTHTHTHTHTHAYIRYSSSMHGSPTGPTPTPALRFPVSQSTSTHPLRS